MIRKTQDKILKDFILTKPNSNLASQLIQRYTAFLLLFSLPAQYGLVPTMLHLLIFPCEISHTFNEDFNLHFLVTCISNCYILIKTALNNLTMLSLIASPSKEFLYHKQVDEFKFQSIKKGISVTEEVASANFCFTKRNTHLDTPTLLPLSQIILALLT